VALSTLSQLGIIFISLGIGTYLLRYFHLITHAFLKALLFLCVGRLIHSSKDYQDIRIIGARIGSIPTINSLILISNFGLIGLPFISAFFSKEIILENIIINNSNLSIYFFFILGIRLTTIYSIRIINISFSY